MKIVETLHKDSLVSSAIIEVLEQEMADIDEMLAMLDGAIGFDYSADVRLVSTDSPPEMRTIAGERIPCGSIISRNQKKFGSRSVIMKFC